jgi:FtsH-binding integral membrane protein
MADDLQSRWGQEVAPIAEVDEGERLFMLRVFNWMALGVAFTGALSLFIASSPAAMAFASGFYLIGFLAILGLGMFAPRIIATRSLSAAQATFWIYAGLWGVVLGPVLNAYLALDPGLVVRAFFITAGTFAGVSLYGYTTKRDLTRIGTFAAMMTWGILLALIVNIFLGSVGLSLILSIAVVGLFSALTAWEVQELRDSYRSMAARGGDEALAVRVSILGALQLYGSFVVLFIHILNILAIMRR